MIRMLYKFLVIGFIPFIFFMMTGCDSQSVGTVTETKEPEPTVVQEKVARNVNESCVVCHGAGRSEDIANAHAVSSETFSAAITEVTIPDNDTTGGSPTVFFNIKDENGNGVQGMEGFRFIITKLVPPRAGNAGFWQSYINTTQTTGATPASWPPAEGSAAPDGTTSIQATYENNGTLIDLGNGEYSYEFAADLSAVSKAGGAAVDVSYEPLLTHRVAIQVDGHQLNPFYDFRPYDLETDKSLIETRDIAVMSSCNECHGNLGLHGGGRVEVEYCVTCHNPGTVDPHSGNNLDLKIMVHKIHRGENLPSVQAGAEYAIWGYRNSKHDYSEVAYPQNIQNCVKCHDSNDAETKDGDNWKTMPTKEACTSCHDNISFASSVPAGMTAHPAGPQTDNSQCANCHIPSYISDSHKIQDIAAVDNFIYSIESITNTRPGQLPRVKFKVSDKSGKPYDILKSPEFNADNGGSLNIKIGWSTSDYNNKGSGISPGQPVSINAVSDSPIKNADGTFTVISSTAIPADVSGSGVVSIEGHPVMEFNAGEYTRIPAKSVFKYFPITDAEAVARREIVETQKCNQCHGYLSLHGGNRNNEVGVCVICHTPKATDIGRRPENPNTTADGKTEETVDFKHIIHAIHGAHEREKGIVLYGYGNREHDFSHVTYPGMVQNCETCHISGTYQLPINAGVLPTTVITGVLKDQDDDIGITPASSVCSSCHDSTSYKLHMTHNGGEFDFTAFEPLAEEDDDAQEDTSGTTGRRVEDQPPGHTTRTDCASCH